MTDQPQRTVTDRLLTELDGLYADRGKAEEVLDKIEADIAALRRALSQMGVEYVWTRNRPKPTVTDRLLNELDGLYGDRRQAEKVLDKIEADIAALRLALSQMGVEYV